MTLEDLQKLENTLRVAVNLLGRELEKVEQAIQRGAEIPRPTGSLDLHIALRESADILPMCDKDDAAYATWLFKNGYEY